MTQKIPSGLFYFSFTLKVYIKIKKMQNSTRKTRGKNLYVLKFDCKMPPFGKNKMFLGYFRDFLNF